MLFELFGRFSDDDTITVRAKMISEVKTYLSWYERAAFIYNIMKPDTMESWLNIMKYEGIKGDEISLHTLAHIYQQHIVVHTKGRPWTMVKRDDKMTESHLPEVCNVHLLYMGNYVFAELKRKPYSKPNPRSMVTDPALQIQAMKKSVNTEIPDPLNLSSTAWKTTSATATSYSAAMLGTNKPQESSTLSTSELPIPSYMTGTNTGARDTKPGYMHSIDTSTVPCYGQPVFPAAKQILPLHPHLSDDEEGSSKSSTTPANEDSEDSDATVIDPEENAPINPSIDKVTKAPPDTLNRECHVQLNQLTEDEINVWTKTETVPEFPEFIKKWGSWWI